MDPHSHADIEYSKVKRQDTFDSHAESRSLDDSAKLHARLSWLSAATMFGSLVMAVIFAISHHLFFLHFDHARIQGTISQQWINRIGTGFAFLVKTLAALSAGSAYVQRQWLILRTRPRPLKLTEVDSIFNLLRNITGFLDIAVWSCPMLVYLASVAWLAPFAAIIPPGTLSVHSIYVDNYTALHIPQILFNSSNFATIEEGSIQYSGPKAAVSRVMFASATSGNILSLPSEYQNISYTRYFYGPGIQCSSASQSMIDKVTSTLQKDTTYDENFLYLSFVPGDADHNLDSFYDEKSVQPFRSLDDTSADSARIFVLGTRPGATTSNKSDLIECRLGNYSYHVQFKFEYPLQFLNILDYTGLNDVNGTFSTDCYNMTGSPELLCSKILSYQAMMDSFGKALTGITVGNHYGAVNVYFTIASYTSIDWTTPATASEGLETMFQNATLSLLSNEGLRENSTQTSSVPVVISSPINIYQYDPKNLVLAYGTVLGAVLLCTIVGLHAMYENGASYSNNFSTVLRTTCRIENYELVGGADRGSNPLPKGLRKARVAMATTSESLTT